MMRRVARGLLLTPALIICALLSHLPAASADGQNGYYYRDANPSSPGLSDCYDGNEIGPWYRPVCFKEYGDWFIIRHVSPPVETFAGVLWRNPASGRKGICRYDGSATAGCNYNFPENSMVYYRAAECWKYRDGERKDCTNVDNWTHRSAEVSRLNDH